MAVRHSYFRWAKANGKLYNFMNAKCILFEAEKFMYLLN